VDSQTLFYTPLLTYIKIDFRIKCRVKLLEGCRFGGTSDLIRTVEWGGGGACERKGDEARASLHQHHHGHLR
jgi:hypothetical protein